MGRTLCLVALKCNNVISEWININKHQNIRSFEKNGVFGRDKGKVPGLLRRRGRAKQRESTSGMQGWITAWRYVGVWFPQRLCTELCNPLRTTAGSWRRAHIDIREGGGGRSKVEQPSQSWEDATCRTGESSLLPSAFKEASPIRLFAGWR